MKTLSGLLIAGALVVTGLIGLANIEPAQATAPKCTAKAVGARGSAFNVNGNKATVRFKVSGRENCRVQLSGNSFYAPTMNGRPYSKQILYQRVTKTYKPGTYSITVALPPSSNKAKGCFYQVDLTYGTHNQTPVLAYGHGRLNCKPPTPPKKIKVCVLKTKSITTIYARDFDASKHTKDLDKCKVVPLEKIYVCELDSKTIIHIYEKNFDSTKHSKDLEDCEEVPPVERIEVCELSSKEIITIDKKDYDSDLHSTTLEECEVEEVPETVKEEAPVEELPETGPAESLMGLFGAGSLVASTGYYLQSRRKS